MIARTVAIRAALVGAGALAGAGGTFAVTSGAHESVVMALGDSVTPRFSVKTDTVLKVVGNKIVANKCGDGAVFLRMFLGAVQLTADTISVKVCGTAAPPAVSIVQVCFYPIDSIKKYDLVQYDSLGRPLTLTVRAESITRAWGCHTWDTIPLPTPMVPLSQKVGDD